MAVLVQQTGGVQVQRVALLLAWQALQAPLPERTKAAQVGPRRGELLEKARQHRRAGDACDPEQFGHERIAPQIRDVGELARLTQQSVHEGQCLFDGQQVIVGSGQGMGQRVGQSAHPVQWPQPTPERSGAGVG